MNKWLLVGLLVAAAPAPNDNPKAAETVTVELSISVAEYDPYTPSKAVMKCVLHNNSKQAVMAPVGYDSETVVLNSGIMTLERRKRDMKLVSVDPGKDQVVFEWLLDDIFLQGNLKEQARDWSWQWTRRPAPPLSPIHKYRAPGFVDEAEFRATVQIGKDTLESSPVVLKVKPSKPPE